MATQIEPPVPSPAVAAQSSGISGLYEDIQSLEAELAAAWKDHEVLFIAITALVAGFVLGYIV